MKMDRLSVSARAETRLLLGTRKPLVAAIAAILTAAAGAGRADVVGEQGGPQVTSAANGVEVVNIVAPNAAGLSHNRYTQYNVDARGLVLNNSTTASISQLGGGVAANANLNGTPARVILNEVVSANRSALNGYTEINGAAAELIVANPYGITCNGCGFINTPRVTLTTGTPNVDGSGNLAGFSIRGGDIAVIGSGLDGTRQDYFDILARSVSLAGQINTKDLQIGAGTNDFNYGARSLNAVTPSGSAPLLALDSSALGGMYADRIRLIATENGVGVRLLGDVAAQGGDLTLSAAGQLQLRNRMSAQHDLTINYAGSGSSADAIAIGGGTNNSFAAGNDLSVTAGSGGITLGAATVSAQHNATLTGSSLTDTGSATDTRYAQNALSLTTTGATNINGTTWNGGSALNLRAGLFTIGAQGASLFSAANGTASGAVSIVSDGNLNLANAGVLSGTTTQLQSNGGSLSLGSSGQVTAGTALSMSANAIDNSGAVQAGNGVALTAATSVSNSGSLLAAGDLSLRLLNPATNNVALVNTGLMQSGGTLSLRGADRADRGLTIRNGTATGNAESGRMLGQSVDIYAQSLANHGTLQSNGAATLALNTTLTNTNQNQSAAIILGGASTLRARDVNNSAKIVAHDDLLMSGQTLTNNAQGSVYAEGDLTLQLAGALDNAGQILTDAALTANGVTTFTNRTGATISADSAALTSNSFTNAGSIQATHGSTLTTGVLQNTGSYLGSVNASSDATINATSITNSGTLQSARDLNLNASTTIDNSSIISAGRDLNVRRRTSNDYLTLTNLGTLQATGALSLRGGATGNRSFEIINGQYASDNTVGRMVGGSLDIYAEYLDNSGKIQGGSGTIDVRQALTNSNHLQNALINPGTNGAGFIVADSLNNGALIVSPGALTITARQMVNGAPVPVANAQGSVFSNSALTLHLSGSLSNYGLILSWGSLTIDGNAAINNYAVYRSGTAIPVDSIGQLYALGDLTITSNSVLNNGYIDSTGGNIAITTNTFINETLAPATTSGTLGTAGGVVANSIVWVGDDHAEQLVTAELGLPAQNHVGWFQLDIDDNRVNPCVDDNLCTMYNLWSNYDPDYPYYGDQVYYRDWTGTVYCCTTFSRAPIVAHLNAYRDVNLTINSGTNRGGQIVATRDINLNRRSGASTVQFVNSGLDIPQQMYTAYGRASFEPDWGWWGQGGYRFTDLYLIDLADFYVTTGSLGTASVTMLGGVMQGNVNPSFVNVVNANAAIIASAATVGDPNSSPRTTPGVNPLAPTDPLNPNAPGFTGLTPRSAVDSSQFPGLSLALPTNPNGLFVVTTDPAARYLVESNPLYGLESTTLGSDYLADRLGLNSDTLLQRLGDASYESQLVTQQILTQTNLMRLAVGQTQAQEMQQLMDNAVWASNELELTFGVALTSDQVNNLKQDILWMVETTVNGRKVLAPVVYLSNATRASIVNGTQIVADSMAVSGADRFDNVNATIRVAKNLSIDTRGDINNTNGTIQGGTVNLHSTDGNINNTTTVTRVGDDANHYDYANNRAQITSTGSLTMQADKGNITATGADIAAGGNATLKADKGDVTLQANTLETKTTTETHSGNWFIGETTTTIVDIKQSTQGSTLKAGGNVTIDADKTANIVGSQVNAKNDVTIDAKDVNIVAATETDTHTEHKSSSGWFSNSNMSVGYSTTTSDSKDTNTRVVQSGITGGGNVKIKGDDSVTITGSNVESGRDLNVDTKRLTTNAAHEESTSEFSSSTTTAGISMSGDSNSSYMDFYGNTTDVDSNSSARVAVASTLKSGGNMDLNATEGSIAHEGTQISSDGDFKQTAKTIDMTAAQNTYSNSTNVDSRGGGISIGADYGAGTARDEMREGNMPSGSAPAGKIKASGYREQSSSNESGSDAVTASITARGNITSKSADTTNMEGVQIQTNRDVTIEAKDLNYTAAQNTRNSSNDSSRVEGGAEVSMDITRQAGGGGHGGYSSADGSSSESTAVVGSIRSGGATTVKTGNDANFTGTSIASKGPVTIDAGGSVNYSAAHDTASSSSSSEAYSGQFDTSNKSRGSNYAMSGGASDQSASSNSSTAVVGMIQSDSNVTIKAAQGDVTLEGTRVDAGRNISVSAGRDVNLTAAQSTYSSESSGYNVQGGGSTGREKGNSSSTMSAGSAGNISGGYNSGSESRTEEIGGSLNGRNIGISSGRDTTMVGTEVQAKNQVAVDVGGKLAMESAQTTTHSSSDSYSGSLSGVTGADKSDGKGGKAGFDMGTSNADSVKNRNAQIIGGDVTIRTGGDMTMEGANVSGGNVTTVVGGNLIVTSRLDTSSSSSTNASGYLGGGTPGRAGTGNVLGPDGSVLDTGINGQYGNKESSSARVAHASGISGGSTQVIVKGDTTVNAGHIGGDVGVLSTQSLTKTDLAQHSDSSSFEAGGGLTRTLVDAPAYNGNNSSSSSTITGNVSVPQVTSILTQPSVQTALLLTKDLRAAASANGGIDNVPVAQVRTALVAAGVNVPANASEGDVRTLLQNAISNGQRTVTTQFDAANVVPSVTQTVLGALGFGQ